MQRPFIQTFLNNHIYLTYFIAVIFLITAIFLGIAIGTVYVPANILVKMIGVEIFQISPSTPIDSMYTNIVMAIRFPRVLLAGLVGASLAIAGAAFQGLLRNPLADPYTLGVSSGASVGAVLVLFFHVSIPFVGILTLPLASITFAFITILLVLMFAKKIDPAMRVETIILTGIIFSAFLGALISLMIALTGDELRQIIGWLLGSVSMRGWEHIKIITPFLIIASIILLFNTKELNALSFGEERAQQLGVDVGRRKLLILFSGSMLSGAAVAVSGTIGFVGLVIPHLTRLICGPNHRHLLPLSMILGSGFLIITDLVSRTIISPTELPIGVITALCGAPIFALILLGRRKERS